MFEKSIFFILVSSHRRVYHKKGVSALSEKEKRIVEKLKDAIPNMSEFDKGYILGKTESFSEKKDDSDQKKESEKGA
jgi:hypothetical protein